MMRRLILGGFAAALLALLTWELYVPRYRPGRKPGEVYGLDVSHHQGKVRWDEVADDGISFVYLKSTEGETWQDPRFDENIVGAQDSDLAVGAYHFFTFCTDGRSQAQNFLETVGTEQLDLPPAVDVEPGGNCQRDVPSDDVVRRNLDEFVEVIEQEIGQTPILYELESDEYISDSLDQSLARWERSLFVRPEKPWTVWQFSHLAKVDGIESGVDVNVADPSLFS